MLNPLPRLAHETAVVEGLSAEKAFPDGTRALGPVNLTVRDGDFITLLGPSGCGKSTLLKMVAGLMEPSDGRLRWWPQGAQALGTKGRKLVFVFHDPTLMPPAPVRGHVPPPLELQKSAQHAHDPPL